MGPFDGSDDTPVGIFNNSKSAVKDVTVDGPGSGLAGFDGDGICSGAYGTWNGSAGCPYGPTGYEGPKTSFVTAASDLDEAEVDFSGGLAPGGTAYFSLEGALATAKLTARKGGLAFTATGSDYSTLGQAGKQDTGSPKQAKACRTVKGLAKFALSETVAAGALSAFLQADLYAAAGNLDQFLSGTGDELDYSATSYAAAEIGASTELSGENQAILTYISQQLAAGVTQITLPSGSKGVVHALAFTNWLGEPDLYAAFRYTHSITVSGTGTLANGSYTGSLTYKIGESYGFNKGNSLLHYGPFLRYLQTTCGAPWFRFGAHWFPVTVTVNVPFTIPAPPSSAPAIRAADKRA